VLHVDRWAQTLNVCNSTLCGSSRLGEVDYVDVLCAKVGSQDCFGVFCILDEVEVLCDEYEAVAFGNFIFR
jgi:hypothetical protein